MKTNLPTPMFLARLCALCLMLGLPMVAGCEEEPEPSSTPAYEPPASGREPTLEDWTRRPGQAAPGSGSQGAAPHGGAPHGGSPQQAQAHPGGGPSGGGPSPAAGAGAVRGTITETMDSGGYTYMHVDTTDGAVWVATSAREVAVGSTVQARGMIMNNFRSNTLNRTFAQLVLASQVEVTAAE